MLQIGLCMLIGAYVTHQAEFLPSAPWLVSAGVVAFALLPIRTTRAFGAFLLGILLTALSATRLIESRLDAQQDGQSAEFAAIIEDYPSVNGESLRFIVNPVSDDLPERIRLSWYETNLRPLQGERWQVRAKLRSPRGFANPDGFDYEAWLFRQGIGATGYVISAERTAGTEDEGVVAHLRQRFLFRAQDLLPDDAARAVLAAITIGARQDISREQWDKYAGTGTSHLMAISGLHIGLAAAGIFFLVRVVTAPFACGRNVRDISICAATAGACGYALVSGMAIPAQRASLMVLLVAAAILLRRRQDPFRVLSGVAVLVLGVDPLATLTPGFQLSFLAVLLLLFAGKQSAPAIRWQTRNICSRVYVPVSRLLVLQCVLLLGLLPVTVLQFGRIAWLAPFANLLVLPVFNVCTVPLALLALILDGPAQVLGDALMKLSWHSIRAVLAVVDIASGLQGADLRSLPIRGAMLGMLWTTALWALLPPGFPGRSFAWIAAIALVLHKPESPPADCVDVQVLDVGQGLSVVIQTRAHAAVYDTGPAFRSGSNSAELVLLPFLSSRSIGKIDKLIVSHADLDHAGGLGAVFANVEVDELIAGEQLAGHELLPQRTSRCVDGMRWHWDGIDFLVIHPEPASPRTGNNASCVLQIDAGGNRALVAGDIERPVEQVLVSRGKLKPTQLVVVPHHGSRTSSSQAFVDSLNADFAVVSAGYGNRWGFPRPDVANRWLQSGAILLTTGDSGAIRQRMCSGVLPQAPVEQRRVYRRYWHATHP